MAFFSGLLGNKIGYGAQPGGANGNYGGMLNGGSNTSPYGTISDLLTGIGVGLLSQGPSTTPISPYAGIGQGLQYANQLGQQRRATGQQQFQNQLLSQEAQRQGQTADIQKQAFEIEKQKGTREQDQYTQQQARLQAYADTIQDPQQKAAFMADPAAYIKNVMPSPSTDVQNYNFYTKQCQAAGQQPLPFNDWQLQQKRATANMTTLNMPPMESAYQTALGGDSGHAAGNLLYKTVPAAQTELTNLDSLKAAVGELQAAGGDVGKLAPLKQKAGELMQAFGIDPSAVGLPADAGPAEAITAITNKLALGARSTADGQGMPGAMSDADRAFLSNSVPNISDTPRGLALKVEIAQRVAKRQTEAAAMLQKYPQTSQGFMQFQNDWIKFNQQHPVFGPDDAKKAISVMNKPALVGSQAAPTVVPQLSGPGWQ